MEYPKWIYSKTEPAKIIYSEDEYPETGWFDTYQGDETCPGPETETFVEEIQEPGPAGGFINSFKNMIS